MIHKDLQVTSDIFASRYYNNYKVQSREDMGYMKYKNNKIAGAVLVILGVIFFLNNINVINIPILNMSFILKKFWPAVFIILPGLALHSVYFSGKKTEAGILVPAGILITLGATMQICMLTGVWSLLVPGSILSVAVGLFELYLFGGRDKGLLIPVAILTVTSVFFFDVFYSRILFALDLRHNIIPIALIVLGLVIMFRNKSSF